MSQLKTKQIVEAHNVLLSLINSDKENKFILSSATRIKLAGNVRKTKPIFDDFNEANQSKVRELGTQILDTEGKPTDRIQVQGDNNLKVYLADINEALDKPVDIAFSTVTAEELAGVTADFLKSHPETKENQIPIDLLADLQQFGILV